MNKRFVTFAALTAAFIFAFQNCGSPKSNQNPSTAISQSSVTCANSKLIGRWSADPANSENPSVELITIDDTCVAKSRLCGSEIKLPPMADHNGQPVQGSTTLIVSGGNGGVTCLPDGNHNCRFSYGPSSTGDVFAADCGGALEFAFYKVPPAPAGTSAIVSGEVPAGPKRIFITQKSYPAKMTVASADLNCMSDPDRPSNMTKVKAMIVHSADRVACTNPNCATGTAGRKDWVFAADTKYYRLDGKLAVTTNSNGIFQNSPALISTGTLRYYWNGLSMINGITNWLVGPNCNNWTSDSSGDRAIMGLANDTVASPRITIGQQFCSANTPLVCVEQ